MSVVTRKSSSARSISNSNAASLTGRMRISAGVRSMSSTMSASRAQSVHGVAGVYGTRISKSTLSLDAPYDQVAICGNEKFAMQNLNDRLASYLEKVRSLESANRKLELQIREFYEKRAPVHSKDLAGFFSTISDLRAQIMKRVSENQQINLNLDNARMATDDFKLKYETEMNMRTMTEADLAQLRGVFDSLTLTRSDLELQLEGLRDDVVWMKRNHEEELKLQTQQSGAVNVEVDCAESVDLTKVLQETRNQYEAVVQKNHREAEKWFQDKVEVLQTQITTSTTEVKTSKTELLEVRRLYQSLEVELQAMLSKKQYLEQNLLEVGGRYSTQLSHFQMRINTLETELQQLTGSIQQEATQYQLLLDIKMRLELEIAEYRRLLEGQAPGRAVVISVQTKEVKAVEEHKPHIERRVKTIVEEIVNGQVVSSTVDTKVQEIQ
ncbi:keratin 99 [Lampris incognitus]|uniref:keratin 99 n=1 Tax=Lampris incognitus TaxID=2546036 RepID=UPI0024B5BFBE|nr:keratin 99 [Lampris incognitus]